MHNTSSSVHARAPRAGRAQGRGAGRGPGRAVRRVALLACAVCVGLRGAARGVGAVSRPEDYVNPLVGSFTDGTVHSSGNTLPLVARPWGFNHFSAVTNSDGLRFFGGNDHLFHWLRLTHSPSPWIGDWCWLLFGPQVGQALPDHDADEGIVKGERDARAEGGGQRWRPPTVLPHLHWEPRAAKWSPCAPGLM